MSKSCIKIIHLAKHVYKCLKIIHLAKCVYKCLKIIHLAKCVYKCLKIIHLAKCVYKCLKIIHLAKCVYKCLKIIHLAKCVYTHTSYTVQLALEHHQALKSTSTNRINLYSMDMQRIPFGVCIRVVPLHYHGTGSWYR